MPSNTFTMYLPPPVLARLDERAVLQAGKPKPMSRLVRDLVERYLTIVDHGMPELTEAESATLITAMRYVYGLAHADVTGPLFASKILLADPTATALAARAETWGLAECWAIYDAFECMNVSDTRKAGES